MSWKIGINFRNTAGYVTDGANETHCLGDADLYPTTRGGVTFGWNATGDIGRDRDSTVDRRLAGVNQRSNNGEQRTFRLDLPSTGSYTIRLALGDAGTSQGYQYCQLLDDTVVKFTIDDTNGTAEYNFNDAMGINRTLAAWPTENAARTGVTFTTTILKLTIGSPSAQTGSSTIAHLYVEREGGALFIPPNTVNVRRRLFVTGY